MAKKKQARKQSELLRGTRVYLSGPMDFVASREYEKEYGWRNRMDEFLRNFGVTVFNPWNKPDVRGLHEYGREDIATVGIKERWTFADSPKGAEDRAYCSGNFWESLHIDLRMVDTSDFTIAYCPTNIYSVGTVHEIVLCRQQRKPVLFVSPKVIFPALNRLKEHLKEDMQGSDLLSQLINEIPIKENIQGIPSLWYMTLLEGEYFFDGFGFAEYISRFGWERIPLDDREEAQELKRPLLPYIETLNNQLPKKWDNRFKCYVHNDDWMLWDLKRKKGGGAEVSRPHIDLDTG